MDVNCEAVFNMHHLLFRMCIVHCAVGTGTVRVYMNATYRENVLGVLCATQRLAHAFFLSCILQLNSREMLNMKWHQN